MEERSMPSWLMAFPDSPVLSVLLLVVALVVAMYGARSPAHRVIQSTAKAVTQACKLTADAIRGVQNRLTDRTREVLLSDGLQEAERQIEQEFSRIASSVERDLGAYPALHRVLADQIQRIDEDYRKATDAPPALEGWKQTIQAAGELAKTVGSPTAAGKAVDALRVTVEKVHDEALDRYRENSRERHRLLAKMVPAWRSMDSTLTRVETAVTGIFERSRHLDDLMRGYRDIASKSDAAERALATSSLTQFATSALVLVIALLGGFINFQLIALPMSEMVGAGDYLTASLRTSEVAALVIIFVEATMGLFLMETLRVTHLFPRIHSLSEVMRRRMMWTAFTLLLVLAGIEAALALMRDMLIADKQALLQSLAATQTHVADGWLTAIPTAGQMLLGFILPFALAFVAIPLESFINSARTVGGAALVVLARAAAALLRVAGHFFRQLSKVLITLYDILIVLPLLAERWVRTLRAPGLPRGRRGNLELGEHS
jgi:hypothetical protein